MSQQKQGDMKGIGLFGGKNAQNVIMEEMKGSTMLHGRLLALLQTNKLREDSCQESLMCTLSIFCTLRAKLAF